MKRILLKLSGEALAGPKKTGFDEATVMEVARQVKTLVDEGIQVGIVIGGGNFWRGRTSENIDRTKADQIGMLATVMNCIYVSEIFRAAGMKTNVLTPFECGSFTKLFSKDRANKYFEKNMVVFMAVPDIRIFQRIQQLYFVQLKLKQRLSSLQKQLMVFMTVTRKQIRKQRNMMKSALMKSSQRIYRL